MCELLPMGVDDCRAADGVIIKTLLGKCEDVTDVTFDTDGQITALTMATAGALVEYQYDSNDTAYYNETGTRDGSKHTFTQESFMSFGYLDNAKRLAVKGLIDCCCLVAFHIMANGKIRVQGIDQTATGFTTTLKKKPVVTANLLSDVGTGTDRVEIRLISESRCPSHFTTLTEAQLLAL